MRPTTPGLACGIVAAVLATGAAGSGWPTDPHIHSVASDSASSDVTGTAVQSIAERGGRVGLVHTRREFPHLRAVTPGLRSDPAAIARPTAGLPDNGLSANTLGIPEIALAAYRNAELAMAATTPGCGVTWHLLAGIGRIESGHANGGSTDSAGTTITPILGPALDGTLPGNEIIAAGDNAFVRAVGPMQFLPSTWTHYAADGNGDGIADPNNVFDAALGAAQYLCSGNLDLRDAAAELRAVLRYNNSMSYASDVLSWSATYAGGVHQSGPATLPGFTPEVADVAPTQPVPTETTSEPVQPTAPSTIEPLTPSPEPPTITIPGLPPIPCGIFCPPPVSAP
ncbi:lytic transglycosylase domain-containing protein [Antrihabitans stalactiti]|uniref:Lytic transglycosylase n=1 Tax=Antrihabitans stalactiti TaxID=2584121 RepID=A0A848KLR5_9NOCA|nr:lytic murein transglycosylase [Antrihabitans stalactiti]NMN96717.1 lytic transglycosylase [Antrihabitans stalactiti]